MLPGLLLKAEPLVVIIKDGERGFVRGFGVHRGGGDVAQGGEITEMKLCCCQTKI